MLRFLDDIFLLWQYSEKEPLDFIEYLNNAHPWIKFTYHYFTEKATILDVDISKNNDGTLDTSIHVKKMNNHQYIEYSSCHPIPCKKGIPFSQAKRYRRIISNDETFEKELENLKSYFLKRNYPFHINDNAFQKVLKNSNIFHISAQNIDCGYSLEPPRQNIDRGYSLEPPRRGGSNEYPQSMF